MIQTLILTFILSAPSIKVENGIVLMTDVEYASVDEHKDLQESLLMDVAFPTVASKPLPVLLFVQGVGWEGGKHGNDQRFIRMLASGGYFACSVDYRLTQTAGFPAAVRDCKTAVQFLRLHAEELGIESTKIGVAGYSSGGHLAALVGFSRDDEIVDADLAYEKISSQVLCVATVSGMLMPQYARGRMKEMYEDWALHGQGITIQDTLPQTYADSGDPPIYLLCGSDDHLAPAKYTKMFTEFIQEKGVNAQLEILPKRGHVITKVESYFGLLHFLDSYLGGQSEQSARKYAKRTSDSRGNRK